MTTARMVLPPEVAHVWGIAGPMLDTAIAHSDGNLWLVDVLYRILGGQDQLWIAEDGGKIVACAVTQILAFPRKKLLSLPFVAGTNLDAWKHHEGMLIEYAKANGCVGLEGYARQGWARRATPGWYPVYTVIRKGIGNE